jgi:hypothetical protein
VSPYHPAEEFTKSDHHDARVLLHDGVRWRVYESRLGQYDRRSRPHLFFESESAVRRVREFPSDWRTLSDAELMRIGERR